MATPGRPRRPPKSANTLLRGEGEGTGTAGGREKGYAVDAGEKDCAAPCVEPFVCPARVEKSAVPVLKFGSFLLWWGGGPVFRTRE